MQFGLQMLLEFQWFEIVFYDLRLGGGLVCWCWLDGAGFMICDMMSDWYCWMVVWYAGAGWMSNLF